MQGKSRKAGINDQKVFLTTNKGVLTFCLRSFSINYLFLGEYKYYPIIRVKILDAQNLIMGSHQGEIFIFNFMKNHMVSVIAEQIIEPILFLDTWFTNANNPPLFYSLNRSNKLLCRNNFHDGQPLFELQVKADQFGAFLGGHVSVLFNVGLLVYKKGLILVSLFSSCEIASLLFKRNKSGRPRRQRPLDRALIVSRLGQPVPDPLRAHQRAEAALPGRREQPVCCGRLLGAEPAVRLLFQDLHDPRQVVAAAGAEAPARAPTRVQTLGARDP